MLHGMFTIYDSAAKSYTIPFYAPTTEVAVRMFTVGVRKDGTPYNEHPSDFTLFHVGEFADEDAEIIKTETPVRVIGAWEIQKDENGPTDGRGLVDIKKALAGHEVE